ncbi:MAG: hypothetical protein GKS00_08010 [Alphaproteobacteria bacterium]|nr:hypothetical protein [Alphaproteobacteria bacterium]
MRLFLSTMLVAFLLPTAAFAQAADKNIVYLDVPDSLKDTEVRIAKILLEKLKVNSSLQVRAGNEDDLILRARFNANKEQNLPTILVIVDTRILNRTKDGKPISQIVSIASFADVKANTDKRSELLEWANKLNSQTIPLRIYLANDRIVAARNLFNSVSTPLSENAVASAFTSIVRAWVALMADLKKNELIAP